MLYICNQRANKKKATQKTIESLHDVSYIFKEEYFETIFLIWIFQ